LILFIMLVSYQVERSQTARRVEIATPSVDAAVG